MKKLVIPLIFSILVIKIFSQNGWIQQYPGIPLPQKINFSQFVNDQTGYSVYGMIGPISKTTDGAVSWNAISPLNGVYTALFFINSLTGYFGTGFCNLIKTTNSGLVLDTISNLSGHSINNIKSIYFLNEHTGFICGYYSDLGNYTNNKILKTTNGGLNWVQRVLCNGIFSAINFVNGTTGFAVGGEYVYNSFSLIYRSTDTGDSWQQCTGVNNFPLNDFFFTDVETGYAGGVSGTMIKTTNCGNTWYELPKSDNFDVYSIAFVNHSTGYYTGTNGIIHKTTNSGASWNMFPAGSYLTLFTLDIPPGGTIYATGYSGVKSTDGGASWISFYTSSQFKCVDFIDVNTGYIAGTNGSILKSTNSGNVWITKPPGVSFDFNCIEFLNSETGFAGGNGIWKTNNGGDNWEIVYQGNTVYSVSFINGSTGLGCGNSGKILRTTDSGNSWTEISTIVSSRLYDVTFADENICFAAGMNGKVLRSSDKGISWMEARNGNGTFFSLAFCNGNTGFAAGTYNSVNGFIIKTTNSGINWITCYDNPSTNIYDVNITDCSTIYVLGLKNMQALIVKTTNSGMNWFEQVNNQNFTPLSSDFVNINTGFIAGCAYNWVSGVVYKTTNGGGVLGFTQINNGIPSEFTLSQNYPNPFNPITSFGFQIAAFGLVKLTVYDLQGKEIQVMVNQELTPGTYEVNFDGGNLPSGVYLYRLEAGGISFTRKMVLVK